MQYSYEEFIEIIKSRRIVIYGAGSMAGRFYSILCKRHLEGNVICCAVTVLKEHSVEEESLQGLEVISLKEAICRYPDAFFCVAVHKANRDEMVDTLQYTGIEDRNYIWAVPYYFELMLSKPIKENIYVTPVDIVNGCDDFSLAFRWLALKQYYGLIDNGYDLYLRSLMIYSNQKTAEKRLESFKSLLENWDKNGYDTESVCKVDEQLHILDGKHRLCAALWHREKHLICDMYRYDGTYEDFEGPFIQDAATLEKNGFSRQEIALAEKALAEMKHPLISVIIPAYNAAGYLGRCLDSIINQTYKNLEIIVVNDGSTDETRQIAEEYVQRDSRIKVIHQANKGQVAARKAGLEIASGEYISAVDSDDWIAINRYEDVYEKGIKFGADVISTDVCNVYDSNHIVSVKTSLTKKIYEKNEILEDVLMKMIDEDHFYSSVMNFTNWNLIVRSKTALKRQLAIDDRISAREGAVYVIGCLIDAEKLAVINGGDYFYVKRSDSFDHKHNSANKEKLKIAHAALRNYAKEIPDIYRERYFREMDLFEYHSYLISDFDFLCRETDEMLFPFPVKKGENIVIYGAGTLGSNLVRHMEKEGEKPILWCDKSYQKYVQEGKEICSPEEILNICDTVDAVLICILNYQVAEKAKSNLIDLGIEGSKIYLIDSDMLTMERLGRTDLE